MSKQDQYSPETQYDVVFVKPVDFLGSRLLPRHAHILSGKAINIIIEQGDKDAIGTAKSRK